MVVKTSKGTFKIIKNYRDAFSESNFLEKYIEECMDRYPFIVGDISSGILRLKGFDKDPKSKNYYGFIDDYLETSCPLGCPYFVLKRIKHENELKQKDDGIVNISEFVITPIVKESFDKESIVLKSTPKTKPNIVLDNKKINALPKGTLTQDLVEIIKQEKNNQPQTSKPQQPKVEEVVNTYVSASPDFDPSKVNNKNRNRNRNNNQGNTQNNNGNNNQNNNHNKNKKHNKKK